MSLNQWRVLNKMVSKDFLKVDIYSCLAINVMLIITLNHVLSSVRTLFRFIVDLYLVIKGTKMSYGGGGHCNICATPSGFNLHVHALSPL